MSIDKNTSQFDRVNALESQLNDVEGLVAALEIVAWEFCQETIQDRKLNSLRSAVIALSSSLDRVVHEGPYYADRKESITEQSQVQAAA